MSAAKPSVSATSGSGGNGNIKFGMENSMRDAAINLRALPEQRDIIDHTATLLGKNRTDFMLEVACSSAQAVILDQIFSA